MAMLRTFMSLAVSALFIELAIAANYTVGGPSGGWDQMTDLKTWASSQTFLVGDNLIFNYGPNHNLLEVSKTDYDSCQTSSPLKTDSGGNTVITLSSPGKRYFVCGTAGHCSQGMKIEIDTLASAIPPASPITPVSSPAPEGSTPESAPAKAPSRPRKSHENSPASSPSAEAPTTSSPPSSLSPPPAPSSANKDSVKISLIIGLSLVMMILAL